MDLAFHFLLSVHLIAFATGLAMNVAMPMIGGLMSAGGAPVVAVARPAMERMRSVGPAAFLALVASGVGMVFVRYGGDFSGLGLLFALKLALVFVLALLIFFGRVFMRGLPYSVSSWVLRGLLAGIVVLSVLAFR